MLTYVDRKVIQERAQHIVNHMIRTRSLEKLLELTEVKVRHRGVEYACPVVERAEGNSIQFIVQGPELIAKELRDELEEAVEILKAAGFDKELIALATYVQDAQRQNINLCAGCSEAKHQLRKTQSGRPYRGCF